MRTIKFRLWDGKEMKDDYEAKRVLYNLSSGSTLTPSHYPIMQFTGLYDRNGKEVYEGDFCRAEFRTKEGIQVIQGHIIMDEFMWCIDCTGSVGDDIFSINRPHNFEVIGNIYEHEYLL